MLFSFLVTCEELTAFADSRNRKNNPLSDQTHLHGMARNRFEKTTCVGFNQIACERRHDTAMDKLMMAKKRLSMAERTKTECLTN